jgi:hypothetical protein
MEKAPPNPPAQDPLDQLTAYQGFLHAMEHITERVPPREFWADGWGTSYSDKVKTGSFSPTLKKWEREGKLGPVILDLGSGAKPSTTHLRENHKFIDVDFGARDENTYQDRLRLALDINEIPQMTVSTRQAIMEISRFLELERTPPPLHIKPT